MPDQLTNDLASLRITSDENPDAGGRRWWIVGSILLGLLGLAGWKLGYPILEANLFKTDVAFTEVMLVSPSVASTELTSTGYVTPQTVSHVVSRLPGRIAKVLVAEGDRVTAGQILLQLEDADQLALGASARTRVAASTARALSARANLGEVDSQVARSQRLVAAGVEAPGPLDNLLARRNALEEAAKAAAAEIKVAQAEEAAARVGLDNLVVRAPIAGTVIAKPPAQGEAARPEIPCIELADFSTLEVEADVPEARLHLVRIGGPAEITLDAFPGKRHRAEVSQVGYRVNRQKASVTVKVRFLDGGDGALPDMAARVSFLSKALDPEALKEAARIVVPEAAVVERSGAKVVFVADASGTVRMTPVTLGERTQGGFELKQGPPPGTRLVKSPPALLADGRPVREKKD